MSFTCFTCGREFDSKSGMFKHRKAKHSDDGEPAERSHRELAVHRPTRAGAHALVEYDDGRGRRERIEARAVEQQLLFEATVDVSGSMEGEKIQTAVRALRDIFMHSMRDEDMFGLTLFSSKVVPVHRVMRKSRIGWERDQSAVLDNLGGGTAMYDAIAHSIRSLRSQEPFVRRELHAKKVTVLHLVITDGEDNESTLNLQTLIDDYLRNPNVQGYHMHVIGIQLGSSGQQMLRELCAAHGGRRATLHLAKDLDDFRKHIELMRRAIEIVLEIDDGPDGRQVVRAVVDRHNFREVLEELSRRSKLVQAHMSGLLQGLERMSLGWR